VLPLGYLRVISMNLKLGSIEYFKGCVNMIEGFKLKNILKHLKTKKKWGGGGCRLSTGDGGVLAPLGGYQKISLVTPQLFHTISIQ